jgi:hypothetical protein
MKVLGKNSALQVKNHNNKIYPKNTKFIKGLGKSHKKWIKILLN